MLVHEAERRIHHALHLRLHVHHLIESRKRCEHTLRHVWRACHALPPRERTIGVLQLRESREVVVESQIRYSRIEVVHQSQLLLRLACSIHHPWCLAEQCLLQFGIALELTL